MISTKTIDLPTTLTLPTLKSKGKASILLNFYSYFCKINFISGKFSFSIEDSILAIIWTTIGLNLVLNPSKMK